MNGIMNENQLTIVKEHQFDKPDIHEIDYSLDDINKDCRKRYFHTFEYRLVYDIQFTKISNNEASNITISHISMEFKTEFYGLIKKMKNAGQSGFIFNQINKLTIKVYSNLSNINIHYYLKLRIQMMHQHFFRKLSQNRDNVKTFCTDLINPFPFAFRKWYFYDNPQC